MPKRNATVVSRVIRIWLIVGAVVLCAPVASRAINAEPPATGVNPGAVAAPTAPSARFSPGVAEVVKLVDAKVDPTVIQIYVQNSPTAYNPSATEIIALRDRGVGPELLTAMLQHGAEVRARSMRAAQAVPSAVAPPTYPSAANPYAPVPGYDYSAQPAYSDYSYSYPASSYAYPSYGYGGYGYGCGWPYYWPSLSFGFGCYSRGGYCGYRYPYGGGGYGRGYYGGHGYSGSHGYYGGGGNYGHGGRATTFAGTSGGFAHGGFSGHSASFAGHGGGSGGHSGGRGR
jgi:hypothetical protein